MLSINMDDVINVLTSIRGHLIAIGVILVLGIAVLIAVKGLAQPSKWMIRCQTGVAMVLALLIVANLICTGPMKTMLDLVSGSGTISEETSAEANTLCAQVTEEGAVLLKNEGVLPLASGSKLNVFGWASTNPVYGGTGSGSLNDAYHTVTLLEGLSNAGIETNAALSQFYTDYKSDRPSVGMREQDWTLPEPAASLYTADLLNQAKEFSDTAMIVIGRVGGEGADLPTDMVSVVNGTWNAENGCNGDAAYYRGSYDDSLNAGSDWDEGDHFLQLSNREEELVQTVCSNFENVIVLYNGANAFELGFVNDYPQIKGVLWCAGTGQSGFNGLGSIISGAVNPSGRLIDTYVYDLTATPTWNNFGSFFYTNMDEFTVEGGSFSPVAIPSFVNYVEGIYVGYKFYETAAAEGLINYDSTVQYPFGYGLSYTTFDQKITSSSTDSGVISLDVTVSNSGSVAGREVVEIYYNPPYTDGGIEKSSANLIDFGKTKLLQPGESEVISISFPAESMASYDDQGAGCYVLEAGDYIISANSDSHTVLDSITYSVPSTITYGENNKRESDQNPAVNQFDFARGDITYLSRAGGFANYNEATAAPVNFELGSSSKDSFYNISNYLTAESTAADEDPNASPITTGAKNNLSLVDMRGLDYDDPQWDSFMDQLTLNDMNTLISLGGYQTAAVESIGKARTNDCDGPASINNNFTGTGSIGFPAGVVIAATWDKDTAYAFGDSIGKMADEMDVSGWYAPAMNIHRTAFAGRNFEYYSEDGILSGIIASNAVKGSQDNGVYAYMKHFALNDQEGNRNGMLCTWSNEQAIREIYLKPFEKCVKEADCRAVMSSFNYIGNRWAGGCNQLCNTVLRDEWGFRGFVETDYFGVYGYMSSDQAIRNGTDLMLVNYATATNDVQFRETAGAQQAMRQSAKNILYVVANSRAYSEENLNQGTPIWRTILMVVNIVSAAILIGLEFLILKGYKKRQAR